MSNMDRLAGFGYCQPNVGIPRENYGYVVTEYI